MTTLKQIIENMNDEAYYTKYKNRMIKDAIKFIKVSHSDGHGKSFIDGEKDRLRKIINCNNIDELLVVERNLLDNNIITNLSCVGKNKMKQSSKVNATKSRLRRKLLKNNDIKYSKDS